LPPTAHYTFEVIDPTGAPKLPKKAADVFKKQCGVLVRDYVPISVQEWHKRKGAPDTDGDEYVHQRYKDALWNDLMVHFSLPECEDQAAADKLREKVKEWTLKKMAEMFRAWKKNLWKAYKKKKEMPVFDGHLAKQANNWKAFQAYKESEDATKLSEKNKRNASKKKYHHRLGAGGYKEAIPKWDRKDQELLAKGIEPEWIRDDWELRARNWFLAHGGSYDEQTGDLLCSDGLRIPRENWKRVVKEIKEGTRKFTPDREKDLLTLVLGNEEHGGRTRGFGPSCPWWLGFAKDQETYRSRARAKQRKQEKDDDKFNQLVAIVNEQQQKIAKLEKIVCLQDPSLDGTAGVPSQRKSSVADSEAPADDARRMIEGGPGYPVDAIKEQKPCELHQLFRNISLKVALGYALPCPPGAVWHHREIPAGYARVGVDEIVPGFNDMELDIPGPEDEKTLGQVLGNVILWDKKYTKFPGLAPMTTPPPSRRRSPTPPAPSPPRSPPHDYGHHSASPSRSPPQPDLGGPPPSPSPPPAKETKRKRAKNAPSMSSNRRSPPRQKRSPLPKVPKDLPKLAYHKTDAEIDAYVKADVARQLQKKKPEPRQVFTNKQIAYAEYFLTLPNQYNLHHKPDDYKRTLQKTRSASGSKSSKSAGGSKSSQSAGGKRADVPQLGQQAKQSIPPLKVRSDVPQLGQQAKRSIPPLKVLSENVPLRPENQSLEEAQKWAAQWNIPVEDIMGERGLPKAVAAPKPTFVMGQPLVSKNRLDEMQSHMRRLHAWYLDVSRNQRTMIVLQVPSDFYFRRSEIHVDFEELFQMYNFEALDKSLMSCYCL